MRKVEGAFNTKESRAVALELLTAWEKIPNWAEKEEIGKRHGRSDKTVHTIIQKLQELELFTENEGSIPLYRIALKRGTTISPLKEVKEGTENRGKSVKELLEKGVSPAGFPLNSEDEEESQPVPEGSEDDLESLRAKVFRMEAQIGSIQKNFEIVVPMLKGLSAKIPESDPPVDNPSVSPPVASVEVPVSNPASQPVGPTNPFAGMTGEQVYDLYLNQREAFSKMLGQPIPADAVAEGDMKALPATVRRIIVEVTAYTQIAYEKALNDEAFDGSFSDFLNQCVYKYFADRGIVLGWHRMPQYQPYPGRHD